MYCICKKDYSWNPITCVCENRRYLQSIVDDLVIVCNEIISVTDSTSRNVTNTILANVMSSVSIKSEDIKVRYKMDCYILHMFLLVTILLFIITIIYYHCIKYKSKQKHIDTLPIKKWGIVN